MVQYGTSMLIDGTTQLMHYLERPLVEAANSMMRLSCISMMQYNRVYLREKGVMSDLKHETFGREGMESIALSLVSEA